jgi:hypothetical protein
MGTGRRLARQHLRQQARADQPGLHQGITEMRGMMLGLRLQRFPQRVEAEHQRCRSQIGGGVAHRIERGGNGVVLDWHGVVGRWAGQAAG